ncbi:MAG: PQQ-like beta-propeller repeat protein [Acidobacteria bacterium]|nr:PQQ-like beta-propeller repeat protein [Acidobacteriota bacterium]MDA1235613.1 PQQ-like beta-propeller repeat protein [Acidobacteriota bacterium]
MRIFLGLLKSLVIVLVVGFGLLFILNKFVGVKFEMPGEGIGIPIVSLQNDEAHYEAIEADRARAAATLAELEPPPVAPTPIPEGAPSVSAPAPEASVLPLPSRAPWPDYRGAHRDGVYDQTAINTAWPSKGLPELWRVKIGGGYASMVVAQGLVYTIEQRRDREVVAAYDLRSGLQHWEHGWPGLFQESMGGPGPRATPTWSDGKLYPLGALGELQALNASNGELLWRRNILEDAGVGNLTWGMSGAPLVDDGRVIVFPGGRNNKSVIAYNAADGSIAWTSQDDQGGYASPQLATLADKRQLLYFSGKRIVGLDPADGSLLWEHPWYSNNDINSAQPIQVDDDHLWVSSSYRHGSELLKIVPRGDGFVVEVVWEKNSMRNKFNSSVLHDGYIYGLDESIMACIDVMTGERKWKGGRYGYGQLLLAGEHIVVLTESGEVVLVKATPQGHEELAMFQALEGKTWNVPAIADGILLVRNQTEMAAYDLRP